MKMLCIKTCQIRLNDQITLVQQGAVSELKADPKNGCFVSVDTEEYVLDFLTASESELKEAKWSAKEAYAAINAEYNLELKFEKGDKKADVIAKILDARYRAVD